MIVFSRSVSDSSFRPRSRFPVQRPDYLAPRGLAFYREKGSDTRYFETWYLQFANYAQNCARNRGEKTEGKLSNPNSWTRITSSRSLYSTSLAIFMENGKPIPRQLSSRSMKKLHSRRYTYHLEIFLLNLRNESLSKVLDSQVFNDSIILPRAGGQAWADPDR